MLDYLEKLMTYVSGLGGHSMPYIVRISHVNREQDGHRTDTDLPRITDKMVRELVIPAKGGQTIERDDLVTGFGVRRTSTGSTAFFLNYVIAGRERRMTIGGYPAWGVAAARERAKDLRKQVDAGDDPLEQKEEARAELTVAELWAQYAVEVLPRKASSSQRNERSMWDRLILPALGRKRISKVSALDVRQLHRRISETTPAQANRVLASIRHVFNIAIEEWRLLSISPVPKKLANDEFGRERYLSLDERTRFFVALDSRPDTPSSLALRLLFLTGARRGQVLKAKWDEFDLGAAVWVRPSAHNKNKRPHRVPISPGAIDVLRRARCLSNVDYVFPGQTGEALVEIKKLFKAVRIEAGIENFRIHDIRHTYASFLVSDGASLPMVGKLLGHTQVSTTNRYAHLEDDPLRLATNRLSEAITGQGGHD